MNSNQTISDSQLLTQAAEGCTQSFEQFVQLYERRMLFYLRQRTRNTADAEDLLQELFLRIYRNLAKYRPDAKASTWVYTIAYRLACSHYRRNRTISLPEGYDPAMPEADPIRDDGGIWDIARDVLNEQQFTALWLFYAEEFPIRQIAELMDLSESNIKVTLHRARKTLQTSPKLLEEISA